MNRFFKLSFLSICLFSYISASDVEENLKRPEATAWESLVDFFSLEEKAFIKVSRPTELFVRQVQKELGLENKRIRVLKMSKASERLMGRENAFAYLSNTLVISEDWFNTLPREQKRALIGHELIHIGKNHIPKKLLLSAVFLIIPQLLAIKIEGWGYRKLISYALPGLAISCWFSRYSEREADKISAAELKNAANARDLMKRIKQETTDPESRFFIKRFIKELDKSNGWLMKKLLATHPTFEERIKYFDEMAKEQEAEVSISNEVADM